MTGCKSWAWPIFDCWASRFGETVTALELAPEGTGYRARTRFSKFFNLPELMNLFKEVADIKTADQLHLPTPQVEYHNVVAQPTDIQKEMVKALSERASEVHRGSVDPSVDNMLKITSDGRKLGLDQRIINQMLPDEPGTKVNKWRGQHYADLAGRRGRQADPAGVLRHFHAPGQTRPKKWRRRWTTRPSTLWRTRCRWMSQNRPLPCMRTSVRKLIAKGVPAEQIASSTRPTPRCARRSCFQGPHRPGARPAGQHPKDGRRHQRPGPPCGAA